MKSRFLFLATVTVILSTTFHQQSIAGIEKVEKGTLPPDGPYIIYNEDKTIRYIEVTANGLIIDSICKEVPESFTVNSHDRKYSFKVELSEFKREKSVIETDNKIFVLGDPHADFDSFISILIANKVIDEEFNWTFQDNSLMIIGDILDRGNDATTILWLVYKLRAESNKVGGNVFYTSGNHEQMVLNGDDRYINEKYTTLTDSLKMQHKDLYSVNTEFGRWIRSNNIIQVIDGNLFVHAGLGKEFLDRKMKIDFVNESTGKYLDASRGKLEAVGGDIEFIYRTYGPLWYRGMVRQDKKYRPISTKDVKKILLAYNVDRIIVGHTIFEDITKLHEGKVIAVNVDNSENLEMGRGRGILIDGETIYAVYDSGDLKKH